MFILRIFVTRILRLSDDECRGQSGVSNTREKGKFSTYGPREMLKENYVVNIIF